MPRGDRAAGWVVQALNDRVRGPTPTRAGSGFALLLMLLVTSRLAGQTVILDGWVRTADGRGVATAAVQLSAPGDTVVRFNAETDALGRFRLPGVPWGEWDVRVRRLGYTDAVERVTVSGSGSRVLEIEIEEQALALPGLTVEADRARASFERSAGATTRELTRDEMKLVPGVAEADVLRAIEMLPGVVTTSDYSSAYNVRGGSADQNLILLDGLPIYNPFHLGGLFSVFNADMVARAELMAGGFPAEYGGRVASVLSVESDGSGAGTDWDGGLSLLAARVSVGTPVPSGITDPLGLRTARARVSVRRSYFDALLAPIFDFPYYLTDAQAYVEGWTPGGSRLSLTAYSGRDVLDLAASDSFPLRIAWTWGNDVIGLRLARPIGGGRSLDARIGWSRFSTALRFPDFGDTEFDSRIQQGIARLDLELPVTGELRLRTGTELSRLSYDNRAVSGGTEFRRGLESGWLGSAWAAWVWRPGNWLIETGARLDAWSADVPGERSAYPAPRLAAKRFLGAGAAAIKLAIGRYTQFVHSLRDEELPLGIDIWVLSGERAPIIVSDQVQGGVEAFRGDWFLSLEAYYRDLDGVATNNFADDPNDARDDLVAGTGEAYGADLLIRRDAGRWRPSLSISWLRTSRTFPDATLGIDPPPPVRYPPIYDRRLDIEFTLRTVLARNIEAGLRWNYGSGLPYTRPLGGYTIFEYEPTNRHRFAFDPPSDSAQLGVLLGPRNAERYPAYHRLDVTFRKELQKSWGTLTPYLDILNLYNRKNPLFYFYEFDRTPPVRSGISMFPFLPTIGAEVRF
ncbi:MAG: TonB-dependent receptor [Gemmatimonadetes bacterium]|nr:TonB-dependent receptor [Gemmatimonadota bacterium]